MVPNSTNRRTSATVAAGAQENYSLDDSLLRSCRNQRTLDDAGLSGLASFSLVSQLMPRVRPTAEERRTRRLP
jgi:hypothetical protein